MARLSMDVSRSWCLPRILTDIPTGRPLKIEFITDNAPSPASQLQQPQPLTLLQRLGDPVSNWPVASTSTTSPTKPVSKKNLCVHPTHIYCAHRHAHCISLGFSTGKPVPVAPTSAAQPSRRQRMKKGPKRLKKREPVTAAQLDQDMDAYRTAATPGTDLVA
jgi:THO complex subunit 4